MSKKNKIMVIWKNPSNRKNYVVGLISKGKKYKFIYSKDIKEAQQNGFQLFLPFNDVKKEYYSDHLFPIFSSRLPDKKRRDIDEILKKYSLKEYDEFELLKQGAELPIDTLKFVEPFGDIKKGFSRKFSVEGVRYYLHCNPLECDGSYCLNTPLHLQLDTQNEFDKYAVKIVNKNGETIGYVPRYHSRDVYKAINNNITFDIEIESFEPKKNCNSCLIINIKYE